MDGSHDGFVHFVDFGVVFAVAGELVDVAFTVDGFESEPTVTIEAAVGIGPFFGEGTKHTATAKAQRALRKDILTSSSLDCWEGT